MKSILQIEDLLLTEIRWAKTSEGTRWTAIVGKDKEPCELTMNDFPDEPLYTLLWQGLKIDFDDAPHQWIIPRG